MFHIMLLILITFQVETLEPGMSNFNAAVVENLSRTGYIEGDFMIGALFPVHSPPSTTENGDPLKCDAINGSEGIELVEAAFYAIDTINNDATFLPNIKLGISIKDDCNSELVALYQTIKMIEEPKLLKNKFFCGRNDSPLIGMIGSASSDGEFQAENLLKFFKIPQIGYTTSSTELKWPYFYLSVAPSEYHQALLIIKILKKYDWRYISVAYSERNYGLNGKYFLEQWVSYYNICISTTVPIIPPNIETLVTYSAKHLFRDYRCKVIVCFCDETALSIILQEMRDLNLAGKFLLLISNDWPIREDVLNGYEEEARGSLMLSAHKTRIPEFDQYFLSRNANNNERNPWFEEYWKLHHKVCSGDQQLSNSSHQCSDNEDEGNSKYYNYNQDIKVAYVIKSIRAFAYGLKNMYQDACNSTDECPEFFNNFNTSKYMEYLTNLSFPFYDEEINFQFEGSPFIGKFDIYNFQQTNESFKYIKVGEYSCDHALESENYTEDIFLRNLNIFENIQYPENSNFTNSVCSLQCLPGYAQVYISKQLCCWICLPCGEMEILNNKSKCQLCPERFSPNKNKTGCEEIPVTYLKWTDVKSLIIAGMSTLIILFTLFSLYIFIKYRHTPVLQATYKELHYVILCGIIMMNLTNFLLISKPTMIVCSLFKVVCTLGVNMVFIPISLMAVQIARIYDQSKKQHPNSKPRCTSLRAQMIITSIFITGILMLQVWESVLREWPVPTIVVEKNPKLTSYLSCKFQSLSWITYLIMVFDLFMIYYAIKIRKISNNFNEAKFLGVFIFLQEATTMAFRITYCAANKFQDISIIIWILLDTSLILIFLFSPKLYVILRKPEKNTINNFKPLGPQYLTY